MSDSTITQVERCLDRLRAGDGAARDELLNRADARLRQLTRKMLKGFRRLERWEDADDVFHQAALRLHAALRAVTSESPRHFFRLAALYIRRELIDLARHYYGPQGMGARHDSWPPGPAGNSAPEQADSTYEPGRLAGWAEFHAQVAALPADEREVFESLWYHDLTQAEVADLLGVARRTVIRRYQSACLRLHQALQGNLPSG
jgi:RNA polymerase sigma-70 factor (ECF subfamily)